MSPSSLSLEPIAERLRNRREELRGRLAAVRSDQKRINEPLSADSADRAAQLENDDVVDAIGSTARVELRRVEGALERIKAGTYGVCVECGKRIAVGRLHAVPYVERCSVCAAAEEGA